MMNNQRNDSEKNNLIEERKKIGIDEAIKHVQYVIVKTQDLLKSKKQVEY